MEHLTELDRRDALVRFAGVVAHELNNIFTAVNGNISLLAISHEAGNLREEITNDLLSATRHGIELAEKLQAFAGRQRLSRCYVDIVEVTSCTIRELRSSSLRDIDIQIAFGEYGCVTLTDRDKLHHVIRELVQNAAEATTDDRSLMIAAGRCTLTEASNSSLPEGEYVFLSVQDNGRGMTHDVARRAFDPLFSTKGGRHGWGLACGAGFVRQCGGDIVLKSVRDVGTTVTVYLPLSKPSAP